jgi:hypothetical protein
LELSPATTPSPAISPIGLTILTSLLAILLAAGVIWRRQPAISKT